MPDPTASGDRYVLWIDGAEVNTWWKATGVHEKYPQGQGATGFAVGVLPTKGLTLPLLSYGRSSLLVSLAWLGVVLRIYHEIKASSRSAVMRIPGRPR